MNKFQPRTRKAGLGSRISTSCARLGLVIGALVMAPATARAHDEGTLKLVSRTFAANDSIAVAGIKFSKRTTLKLTLVGLGGRFTLAEVTTDSTGSFGTAVRIPANAAPGDYRLVAVADDGDEAASLDVSVTKPVAAANGTDEVIAAVPAAVPTDQPLQLEEARSTLVTTLALGVIVLALGAGFALVRSPKSAPDQSDRDQMTGP